MGIKFESAETEQMAATDETIYTAPALTTSIIIAATVNNEESTASSATINIVKSGGSAAVTNEYITDLTIPGNDGVVLSKILGHVLKPGDFVSGIAADADRLNFKLGLKEIT